MKYILPPIIAALVLIAHLSIGGLNRNPSIGFREMLTGEAQRPFVGRQLVPIVVSAVATVLRTGTELADVPDELTLEGALTIGLMLAALGGFAWAFEQLHCDLFDKDGTWATWLALAGVALFAGDSFMYDLPTLCLFTLAMLLMYRQQWRWYLVVFAAATLNRETSFLLILLFVLQYRQHYGLILLQVIIYLAIRGPVFLVFRDNPGQIVFNNLNAHIYALNVLRYTLPLIALCIALVVLMAMYWQQKSIWLRRAAWLFVPSIAVYFIFGYPYEIRVFLEIYSIGALLIASTIYEFFSPNRINKRSILKTE